MKRLAAVFVITAMILSLLGIVVTAEPEDQTVEAAAGGLVAFPGAEGGGMYATGARGASSPTIYHVTNLNDSGTGSLRDAVSKDNRIIVFDVAGTIKLTKQLPISNKNLTILGQTAPGDGICIKGSDTYLTGQNIIMRYIRFRMGTPNETETLDSAQEVLDFLATGVRDPEDAFGAKNASDFIIDHCSMSWSTDECCSVYAVKNATVQWCIIGEGLNKSIHVENGDDWQEHSYGGLVGGINLAFHHNLWANCKGRFPRIATSSNVSSFDKTDDRLSLTDIRNNVMYNWGVSNSYGGENLTRVNLVNNYYKEGPATSSKNKIYNMSLTPSSSSKHGVAGETGWGTDIALSGNYYNPTKSSSKADSINADNKNGVTGYADATAYKIIEYDESSTSADMMSHTEYIKDYPITTTDAETAFNDIMKYAGVSHRRDSVDERLVNDAINRQGSVGNNGLLNFPGNLLNPPTNNSPAEAWPTYTGTKAQDSDNDGMPDTYEDEKGLDKNNASDALKKAASGYYNIEEYANSIVDGASAPASTPDPTKPTATPKPTAKPVPTETPKPTEDPNKTPAPTIDPSVGITAQNESKFWKFDDPSVYGSYTSDVVYDNLVVKASEKDVVLEKSNKTIDGVEFSGRLKLRGKGSETNRSIMFLPGKDGEIKIYCMSGGSDDRSFDIYQNGEIIGNDLVPVDPGHAFTVNVTGGIPVYMYSTDNGINIYGIDYEVTEAAEPTKSPSIIPTSSPTDKPVETALPTLAPKPTAAPTDKPVETALPTPVSKPTAAPTETPGEATALPTLAPKPTDLPTAAPTAAPGEPQIVSVIAADGKTDVTLKNITSGIVIAAKYEGDMLKDIKIVDVSTATDGVVTINGIEADKVFVWDSLSALKPLCTSK